MEDQLHAEGVYEVVCTSADGEIKWQAISPNLVMVAGANLMLDCAFSNATPGTAYSGLITSNNFGNITQNDSMVSKGWTESNCYGAQRPIVTWQSANSGKKVWSRAVQFAASSSDIINGCFLLYGTAASRTVGDGNGTLWSATTFQNGSQSVQPGDTISVQYATSIIRISSTINNFVVTLSEGGRALEASIANIVSIENEMLAAVDKIATRVDYRIRQGETGTAAAAQLGSANFATAQPIFLDARVAEDAVVAYHVAIGVAGSASELQDASEIVHEQSTADSPASASKASPGIILESSSVPASRTAQNARVGYNVSAGEGSSTAAVSQVPAVNYKTFVFEGDATLTAAISDAIVNLGQFILDDTGTGFVLDDAGNKILTD